MSTWVWADHVGDKLTGHVFETTDVPGRWRTTKKILERSMSNPGINLSNETVVVYECSDEDGKLPDSILKLRMQIINNTRVYWNTKDLGPEPTGPELYQFQTRQAFSYQGYAELDTIRSLNELGCKATPAYRGGGEAKQKAEDRLCLIPNGFVFFIVMERCPGVVLSDVWTTENPADSIKGQPDMSAEEQDQVEAAFKEALLELWRCGYDHLDPRLENIIWDKQAKKCYIIDLESCSITPNSPQWEFGNVEYTYWGLDYNRFNTQRMIKYHEDRGEKDWYGKAKAKATPATDDKHTTSVGVEQVE